MNDPWQLFGLDLLKATEKEIKIAYARLLKDNRPDVNPKGFRMVYDAYQAAMRRVGLRSPQTKPEASAEDPVCRTQMPPAQPSEVSAQPSQPDEPGKKAEAAADITDNGEVWIPVQPSPASTQPPNPGDKEEPHRPLAVQPTNEHELRTLQPIPSSDSFLSPDCAKKLSSLRRLLRTLHFPWTIQRAFDTALRGLDEAHIPPKRRAAEWQIVFDGNLKRLANKIPDPPLVSLVQLDEFSLCYEVVNQWVEQGKWKRLSHFARCVMDSGTRIESPSAAKFVAFLALKLATFEPDLADELASLAYANIGLGERPGFTNAIDSKIWMERQVLLLPRRLQRFWRLQLTQPNPFPERTKFQARRMIYATIEVAPGWPGWGAAMARMPTDLRSFTERWLEWFGKGFPLLNLAFLRDLRHLLGLGVIIPLLVLASATLWMVLRAYLF